MNFVTSSYDGDSCVLLTEVPTRSVQTPQSTHGGIETRCSGLMHEFPRPTLAHLDAAENGRAFERPDHFSALVGDWLMRLSVT